MKVCPSGALALVPRHEIRVGLAVWDEGNCLRTIAPKSSTKNDSDQENCQICIDTCPVGESAIRLTEGRIEVIDPRPIGKGCTGCGVCQEHCPTRPDRAIRIISYEVPKNIA
jgi:Pyruvate/2-oxoacid:ferredoxin oxidoreductase delta subunit